VPAAILAKRLGAMLTLPEEPGGGVAVGATVGVGVGVLDSPGGVGVGVEPPGGGVDVDVGVGVGVLPEGVPSGSTWDPKDVEEAPSTWKPF